MANQVRLATVERVGGSVRADNFLTVRPEAEMWECWLTNNRYADGVRGASGAEAAPALEGVPGTSPYLESGTYNYDECIFSIEPNTIGDYVTIVFVRMVLDEAERQYLNSDYRQAAPKLIWLDELCLQANMSPPVFDKDYGLGWTKSEQEELVLIGQRVQQLLGQMSLGLSYFGQSRDFVTLVSLTTYGSYIDAQLTQAKQIEDAYMDYFNQQTKLEQRRTALSNALTAQQTQLAEIENRQQDLDTDYKELAISNKNLLEEQMLMEQQLFTASRDFRKAVEMQANGCSFEDIVRAGSAVVSFASVAYGNVGGIVAGVGGLSSSIHAITDVQGIIKAFEVAKEMANKIEAIRDGFAALQKKLNAKIDQNNAKLGMLESDFEEALKPFLALDQAVAYRDLMRRFLDLTKKRNDLILELDAIVSKKAKLLGESKQSKLEIKQIKNDLSTTQNPMLGAHVAFMRRALDRTKRSVFEAMYRRNAALCYLAASDHDLNVDDSSIAHMEAANAEARAQILQEIERRGAAPQTFKTYPPIEISADKSPQLLEQFREAHRLSFALHPGMPEFKNWVLVMVRHIQVKVPSVTTTNGSLYVRVIHHGRSVIQDLSGTEHRFSHRPRVTFYQYNLKTGEEYGDGGLGGGKYDEANALFADVSPFSLWSIELAPEDNAGLDLSKVDRIEISFDGAAYAKQ